MIASISIKIKEPGLYCKKRFHNGFRNYIVVEKNLWRRKAVGGETERFWGRTQRAWRNIYSDRKFYYPF
jgi:hypothetical protein